MKKIFHATVAIKEIDCLSMQYKNTAVIYCT